MKKNSFFKLDMLFLKILSEKDCYGYEITHTLKERTHGRIDVKEGTLYPILYHYEDIGYITSMKKVVGKRLTRVYYHLEKPGKDHLDKMYHDYCESVEIIRKFMEDEE